MQSINSVHSIHFAGNSVKRSQIKVNGNPYKKQNANISFEKTFSVPTSFEKHFKGIIDLASQEELRPIISNGEKKGFESLCDNGNVPEKLKNALLSILSCRNTWEASNNLKAFFQQNTFLKY